MNAIHLCRRTTIALVFLCALAARSASASPVTLNFEAQWTFRDFEWKFLGCNALPLQCSFVEGMAAIGVTDGSTISWSLTFDDNAPLVGPGVYQGLHGEVTLGQNTYTISPSTFSFSGGALSFFAGLSGPSLPLFWGSAQQPDFFQLSYGSPGFTSNQLNAINWTNPALLTGSPGGLGFINFNVGNNMGVFIPRLVSVSVPETSALPLALSGLACLGWFGRHLRTRRRRLR
jgi:hypothetical protein